MTDQNGQEDQRQKPTLPQPPILTSDRIKGLLSRALTHPESLSHDEVREIAASVVFYLQAIKNLTFPDD